MTRQEEILAAINANMQALALALLLAITPGRAKFSWIRISPGSTVYGSGLYLSNDGLSSTLMCW